MEKELEKLNNAIEKVFHSNLDDNTKEFVLEELKRRVFDLRNEISTVNKNVEIFKGK